MLQWMGGSRKKVTTSRNSIQKRQKQYFEQRKRQQQSHLQTISIESSGTVSKSCDQNSKGQQSLDIINLLYLSTVSQEQEYKLAHGDGRERLSNGSPTSLACMTKPSDYCEFQEAIYNKYTEAGAKSDCKPEIFPKKVLSSTHQNNDLTGTHSKPNHWDAVNEQQLSILDLVSDGEPNGTVEECPTHEAHVAFSVEGLGNVRTETPPHSPEQQNRISYGCSLLHKEARKSKFAKNPSHVLDDLEFEVDAMMQDIDMSLAGSTVDFSTGMDSCNNIKPHLAAIGDTMHYYEQISNKSSFGKKFFYDKESSVEDIWDARSSFHDKHFLGGREYDMPGNKSKYHVDDCSDFLENEDYKSYSFGGDIISKKRVSSRATQLFDILEPPAQLKCKVSEKDFDLLVSNGARCSTLGNIFPFEDLTNQPDWFAVVPEDVKDYTSLPSEESCSSSAVNNEENNNSPSRLVTGVNTRMHGNPFKIPANNCNSRKGKRTSMQNLSKSKAFYHSKYDFQDMVVNDNLPNEEGYASVDLGSGLNPVYPSPDENVAYNGFKDRVNLPSFFQVPELHLKAKSSIGEFRKIIPAAQSIAHNLISEKFAFNDSHVFLNAGLVPTQPVPSPDNLEAEPLTVSTNPCEASISALTAKENSSKHEEIKVKLLPDKYGNFNPGKTSFNQENSLFTENEMGVNALCSECLPAECKEACDAAPEIGESLLPLPFPFDVQESSSSILISDKLESKTEKKKDNHDAVVSSKYDNAGKEIENCQSQQEANAVVRSECSPP